MSKPYVPTKAKLPLTLPIIRAMQQVEGYLYDEEADLMVAAASHALTKCKEPSAVVEIGSYFGKSTVILGLVAKALRPRVKVYAIDPHEGHLSVGDDVVEGAPTFMKFMENIANAGLRNVVVPIKKYSSEVRWNKPICFLFIDGLHDYRSVAQDFVHFSPWVVDGGYVAFHDYGKNDFPGVTTFVDEIVDRGYWQPVQRAAGLIVLEKPDKRRSLIGGPTSTSRLIFGLFDRSNLPSPDWSSQSSSNMTLNAEEWGDPSGHVRDKQIEDIVAAYIRPQAKVLVIDLNSELPTGLRDWQIWTFQGSEESSDNSRFQADDGTLVAQLETARADGADYLIVLGNASDWLQDHSGFRQHLDDNHFYVEGTKETERCVIYELFPTNLGTDQHVP